MPLILQSATPGIFSDGSDGAVSVSGAVTLTADVHATSYIVNNGGAVTVANFAIYATKFIWVKSGATLIGDGIAATSSTGAIGIYQGTQIGGADGSDGSTTVGNSGPASIYCLSPTGGAAGAGTSGAGGSAGTAVTPIVVEHSINLLLLGGLRYSFDTGDGQPQRWQSIGSASGGGGGDGSNAGGGGGAGGETIALCAPSIIIEGSLSAVGGAGYSPTAGNTGGGGGAHGGQILAVYSNSLIMTGSYTVAGGAGGTHHGSGSTDGSPGSSGLYWPLRAF